MIALTNRKVLCDSSEWEPLRQGQQYFPPELQSEALLSTGGKITLIEFSPLLFPWKQICCKCIGVVGEREDIMRVTWGGGYRLITYSFLITCSR